MRLQQHYFNLWKKLDDPTRCDFEARTRVRPRAAAEDAATLTIQHDPALDADDDGELDATIAPVIVTARLGLYDLARRSPKDIETAHVERSYYTITSTPRRHGNCRDMLDIQDQWDRYFLYQTCCAAICLHRPSDTRARYLGYAHAC